MLIRILKILFGVVVLVGGLFLGFGLYFVFSGKIKMTDDMAFGVAISCVGCPIIIGVGINFIINKNAKL